MLSSASLEPGHRVRHVAAGGLDHRRADVDGGQVEPSPGQLPGELARAAADLEYVGTPADPRTRADSVDDLWGIALAGGVIQPSDVVEQTPQLLSPPALLFRLGGHDLSLPTFTPAGQPIPARIATQARLLGVLEVILDGRRDTIDVAGGEQVQQSAAEDGEQERALGLGFGSQPGPDLAPGLTRPRLSRNSSR